LKMIRARYPGERWVLIQDNLSVASWTPRCRDVARQLGPRPRATPPTLVDEPHRCQFGLMVKAVFAGSATGETTPRSRLRWPPTAGAATRGPA